MQESHLPLWRAAVFAAIAATMRAAPIVGLTITNQIVRFDSSSPGTMFAALSVTGLASGQQLVSIDNHPLDGVLAGIASDNAGPAKGYVIYAEAGAARELSTVFMMRTAAARRAARGRSTLRRRSRRARVRTAAC